MTVDLNVRVPTSDRLNSFIEMAGVLRLTGIATTLPRDAPFERLENGISLYTRVDVTKNSLGAVKAIVKEVRSKAAIVAVPIRGIELANWAAEDDRVDILTLDEPLNENNLRESTARLAATSDTALEVSISPLLTCSGLARSRIVKVFRENIQTARDAGMRIILSSGAKDVMDMRSSIAMRYVGLLLGFDRHSSRTAVDEVPLNIIMENMKRLSVDYVAPGVEIVRRGENE